MGRIDKLWIKPRHRAPVQSRHELHLLAGKGIEGNADAEGSGSSDASGVWRQVTVISADRWERVRRELGDVDPSLRRANVMVSGVDLRDSRGKILRLGRARIEIRGETRPCTLMDEAHDGLRAALDADWGGGAYGVVMVGGRIRVGDEVSLADQSGEVM